jgi:hypothetical protein
MIFQGYELNDRIFLEQLKVIHVVKRFAVTEHEGSQLFAIGHHRASSDCHIVFRISITLPRDLLL